MAANLIMPEATPESIIKVEPGVFNIKHDETDDLLVSAETVSHDLKSDSEQKEAAESEYRGVAVKVKDANNILISNHHYKLVYQYRAGFDAERIGQRFEAILNKYDYIVGDWGYEQLRLRGFYGERNHSANRDQNISTLQDYINEFCNFGCAFFVLEKDEPVNALHHSAPNRRHKRNNTSGNKTPQAGAKPVNATGKTGNHKTKANQQTHSANKPGRSKTPTHTEVNAKNDHHQSAKSKRNQKTRTQNQTRSSEKSSQPAQPTQKQSNFKVHELEADQAKKRRSNKQPTQKSKATIQPRQNQPTAKQQGQSTTNRTHEFHIRQLDD